MSDEARVDAMSEEIKRYIEPTKTKEEPSSMSQSWTCDISPLLRFVGNSFKPSSLLSDCLKVNQSC